MYLILLLLGAALTVAGIALGASGVSVRDHLFDATVVTPAIVSAVGGLLLIGLGLGLRVLQRIEKAIAARPVPRATRLGEASEIVAAKELAIEPARIPFPSKPASAAQATSGIAPAPATGEKPLEDLPEKFSAALRPEGARQKNEMDFALAPSAPPRVEEQVGEAPWSRRRNGAAPARTTPRFELGGRAAVSPDRQKGPTFDAVWPKGPRPLRAAQSAPAQGAVLPAVQEPAAEGLLTVASEEAPESISILKSGVVDGMAYTLYSDGSIEAQLPQGTLRFGSIAELRTHIEQGA